MPFFNYNNLTVPILFMTSIHEKDNIPWKTWGNRAEIGTLFSTKKKLLLRSLTLQQNLPTKPVQVFILVCPAKKSSKGVSRKAFPRSNAVIEIWNLIRFLAHANVLFLRWQAIGQPVQNAGYEYPIKLQISARATSISDPHPSQFLGQTKHR